MDEIDALRRMRTALAEEESPERLNMRTDWRAARWADVPERPRRGLKVPLLSTAAATAVAAGAVTVVALQPDDGAPPAPGAGGPELQGNVLLVAATNAQKAPTGRYWHTKTVMGDIYGVGKSAAHHYKVDSRQAREEWIAPNGAGRQTNIELTDVPLTAQDRQKWQAAGSPAWVRIPNPDGDAPALLDMSQASGSSGWRPFPERFYGMTAGQLAQLPTQPKALKDVLLNLKGHWHAVSSDDEKKEPIRALQGQERVRALSDVAGGLLSIAPAPPKVRAAVFRLLADIPGVKAEGRATDPLGRAGAVVSLPLKTTTPLGLHTAPEQLGTYKRQFIVDPAKGRLLAIRDLVATPPHGSRELPPGDDGQPRELKAKDMPDRFHKPGEMAAYQVFEIAEWTDADPPS
ncbi:hypothetical protein E1293_30340 [Actinomadura darangshiensis]|uniref:CU044_5270 family protein n=1 Tax=Actinomadura darangshiensis TaxID=705336 RepID=A0A4R5AMK9_9ACTN|nr:CU044_5270 family protein [Actinomadura darangshiensis]TDD73883.1 hypothetical protein E1293_30340 [Actinomadura darangshiensis]